MNYLPALDPLNARDYEVCRDGDSKTSKHQAALDIHWKE